MNITDDILNEVQIFGSFEHTPSEMALLLNLSPGDEKEFILMFYNQKSDIRRAWEKGKILKQQEILEALEVNITKGNEGSGESARALQYIKKNKQYEALRKDFFGV